jgi:inhibitor of KinA
MANAQLHRIYPCGDQAVTLELGNAIDLAVNRQVQAVFNYIQSLQLPFVLDLIPSYHTITVVYDGLLLRSMHAAVPFEYVSTLLLDALANGRNIQDTGRKIRIPVCYDASFGPDLAPMAAERNMSVDEVITLHSGRSYHVYLIGFLPGFAYMGTVDARIAAPRKTSPAKEVAAGTVGIAGEQTGIYPLASPGGWQLIGRTPLMLFDAQRASPSLLQPGDEVEFYPITITEFQNFQHEHPRN